MVDLAEEGVSVVVATGEGDGAESKSNNLDPSEPEGGEDSASAVR